MFHRIIWTVVLVAALIQAVPVQAEQSVVPQDPLKALAQVIKTARLYQDELNILEASGSAEAGPYRASGVTPLVREGLVDALNQWQRISGPLQDDLKAMDKRHSTSILGAASIFVSLLVMVAGPSSYLIHPQDFEGVRSLVQQLGGVGFTAGAFAAHAIMEDGERGRLSTALTLGGVAGAITSTAVMTLGMAIYDPWSWHGVVAGVWGTISTALLAPSLWRWVRYQTHGQIIAQQNLRQMLEKTGELSTEDLTFFDEIMAQGFNALIQTQQHLCSQALEVPPARVRVAVDSDDTEEQDVMESSDPQPQLWLQSVENREH